MDTQNLEVGSVLMVLNVPREKVHEFDDWLDDNGWVLSTGYSLFRGNQDGVYTLVIDSSLSHTWRDKLFPELVNYFNGYEMNSSVDTLDTL